MADTPFDLSKFDPSSLDLSHLVPAERDRILRREFYSQEVALLLDRKNPWTKSGKPAPLPQPLEWSPESTSKWRKVAERKEAQRKAEAREIENAFDRALRRSEDRARAQRDMEDMGRRHGFRPFGEPDEFSRPQRKSLLFPDSSDEPSNEPNKAKGRSHDVWLWNGLAVVIVILAAVFWGLLFVVAETFFAIGIVKAPWFEKVSSNARRFYKGSLIALIGLFLFGFWWYVPPPDIVGALRKVFGSNAANPVTQPTPEASPSVLAASTPLPSRTANRRPPEVVRGVAELVISSGPNGEAKATVRSSLVRANSTILVTGKDDRVSGALRVTNIKPGVSFDILSNNGGDDGKVYWVIYP